MRCIRTPGKKSEPHLDPTDPPRRRANKQRGHGTYDNDRPPIVGTVGRQTGNVRLRMVKHTDGETLCTHVEQFTQDDTLTYTDEWRGYHHLDRPHATVCHAQKEWARDDDGDGLREVHINTIEGMWTLVRNFMRLFRGVHKKYLSGYLAICEFHINLKRISPDFVAALVAAHL
jgi:transposase